MGKPNRRLARLNEQFRREITAIIGRSVRDPRVQDVVVNSVEVTPDLWLARVFVVVGGDDDQRAEALQGLEAASSFIRRELGAGLHIRRTPELRFLQDETFARASRIEEILKGLEGAHHEEGSTGDGDTQDRADGGTEDPGVG